MPDTLEQDFTHVVVEAAPYYIAGPWQGSTPDGHLPDETKVTLLQVAGSFSRVQSENGVEAWVPADRLELIQRTPEGEFKRITEEGPSHFTHITMEDIPYFIEAPAAEGRPQDDILPAETRVMLLDIIGSGQVRIRSESDIEAWVDATYLRPV